MEDQRTSAQDFESALRTVIQFIGDDPDREGLKETPARVRRAYTELFSGYDTNVDKLFKTFVDGACDEMVILKNLEFFSMCEHHVLPFFGTIHIAYLPNKHVIGLSKLARVVEVYSKRLQIQERMTAQIADCLFERLKPKGVMVVAEAKHFCMIARGVNKQNSVMTTSAIRGKFEDQDVRNEFLKLIK